MQSEDSLVAVLIGNKPRVTQIHGGWVVSVPRSRDAFIITPARDGAVEIVSRPHVRAQLDKLAAANVSWTYFGLWDIRPTPEAWKKIEYDSLVNILTMPAIATFETGPAPLWQRAVTRIRFWITRYLMPPVVDTASQAPATRPAGLTGTASKRRAGAVSPRPRRSISLPEEAPPEPAEVSGEFASD